MLIPYMRKSSGEDPTESQARQRAAIRAWAEANAVELGPEVWEPGVSGKKSWRERGLGEALASVERGEASGVICEEQSRLSRENMKATAEVWEELERIGARLVCTAEGLDTATGDHELRFNINAALAREQWKQYARRMASMKARKIEAGVWIGPVPLGYAKNDDKTLRVDPEKAPTVVRLFEARAGGASIPELRDLLEAGGISYSLQGVRTLLRNDVYTTGRATYGEHAGPPIEGGAIVDLPTWAACQRAPGRVTRPGNSRWLLTGLAVCSHCERNLHPHTGHRWVSYFCANRACPVRPRVGAVRLDTWVRDTVFTLLGDTIIEPGQEPSTRPLEEALEVAERRLEQVMADGVADELGELWAPEAGRRRRARDDAAAALGQARAMSPIPPRVRNLREEWGGMTIPERREALCVYLVERIEVGGPRSDSWVVALK